MSYEVAVRSVESRRVAVVRDRLRWAELAAKLIPLLDRVYVAVRAGSIVQSGQNIFIYRDGSKDGVSVEVGIQVAEAFDRAGDVVFAETPSGEAACATHIGPYSRLGGAHEAVIRWCKEQGRTRAGVWWEVYGDWQEDADKLQTEICYLLLPAGQSVGGRRTTG